jgi:hypothetical protein
LPLIELYGKSENYFLEHRFTTLLVIQYKQTNSQLRNWLFHSQTADGRTAALAETPFGIHHLHPQLVKTANENVVLFATRHFAVLQNFEQFGFLILQFSVSDFEIAQLQIVPLQFPQFSFDFVELLQIEFEVQIVADWFSAVQTEQFHCEAFG